MNPTPISSLAALDCAAFVAALEGVFEHSPWIAERTWTRGPFATHTALTDALLATLRGAARNEQLALIRAHPELAGRAAIAGELTAESTREQASARLDACSPEEFTRLQTLNAAYTARFGFPFILAVRGLDRATIIAHFATRLENTPAAEFAEALRQIERIATLRLAERFCD